MTIASQLPDIDPTGWHDRDAREAARMLKTLMGNLDGMVYRCLYDSQWTMEFVSEGCLRLTGYAPGDLLFNHRISYERITHGEDRERVRQHIRVAVERHTRYDVEYRLLHADGSERWVWERGTPLYDPQGNVFALEGLIQDVTERVTTFVALREAEQRYHSLFENAIEGIFRTSTEGRYIDANPALARIYGYGSPRELMDALQDIGNQLYVDRQRRDEFLQTMRVRGMAIDFQSQVYRRDGSIIWISENARAVYDTQGNVVHFDGTVEDITERKGYQARIEHQANFDALTGLANRALLKDRLQHAIYTAAAFDKMLAVLFVDLDHFKYINDSLGHAVGDELLQVMAQRLRGCVQEQDTVARLGGDEFVLVCAGHSNVDSVRRLTTEILQAVSATWRHPKGDFNVTCSIGAALYPSDGTEPDLLLRNADAAMYRAKESGRHALHFYTAELNARLTQRLEMERNLRRAIEQQHLLVHYQPRVDLSTGRIIGAEALVRWQPPGEPLVAPARFIPLAEETGLIADIGNFVLWTACRQNRAWQDEGYAAMSVSVNVSPRQFQQADFAQTVRRCLLETGLDARYLELEITENMVVHDAPGLISMLQELRALGVQISVDDFGTGYSSLSYLKRFPVHRLKIDRSFINDVTRFSDDAAIVRTIITLGHNLGLKVIAEGVETQAQLDFLRSNACDEMQGYLFSPPVPADALRSQLPKLR